MAMAQKILKGDILVLYETGCEGVGGWEWMNDVGGKSVKKSVELVDSFPKRCKRPEARHTEGKQHVIIAFPRQSDSTGQAIASGYRAVYVQTCIGVGHSGGSNLTELLYGATYISSNKRREIAFACSRAARAA